LRVLAANATVAALVKTEDVIKLKIIKNLLERSTKANSKINF